jgi:hypothetical protein
MYDKDVDIPVTATARSSQPEVFWYVSEDVAGIHARGPSTFPTFQKDEVRLGQEEFDIQVGKIRVFAAPGRINMKTKSLPASAVNNTLSPIERAVPARDPD